MSSIIRKNLEGDYKLLLSWRYSSVEFLGLPSLKDNRPLTLEEIYVPLSFTWESDHKGERLYLPQALETSRHLVLLGDPGSGKSTLVKLITYSFGRAEPTALSRRFGPLLPVPIILRDYPVRDWKTKEDMLKNFIEKLDEEIRPHVTVEWLLEYLREGRGFLLIDGLDEVGNLEDRLRLRKKIVRPLLAGMLESYSILTSRIIGYEEARFESFVDLEKYGFDESGRTISAPLIRRCYVAPFNDEDIEQFITRWYAVREPDAEQRRVGVESLNRALNQNDRIKRLATNPSLLTLMSLIHRVTAHQPSGRIKLYDKIVEAYLETIQNYRKLDQYPASLDQMKRWLARVGWEMQSRRGGEDKEELLVPREEILKWLAEAIAVDREGAEEEAAQFLEYVARRSGLLIPRGPEEFAFVHLTFQEYFAAFHLRGFIARLDRLVKNCDELIEQQRWHETLGLLFEMLAEFPGAGDDLLHELIEKSKGDSKKRSGAAELFSALLHDDQNGLSLRAQKEATVFALDLICDEYNTSVINRLKELPTPQFSRWIKEWMEKRLSEAMPDNVGEYFFLVGDELVEGWSQRLEEWVAERGNLAWTEYQIEDVALIGGASVEVCEWAAQRLPLTVWLSPQISFYSYGEISLAELNAPALFASTNTQNKLLIQSGMALAISNSQIVRDVTNTLARARARARVRDLARALARARARARDLARDRARDLARDLARARARDLARARARDLARARARARARDLVRDLAAAISSPRLDQIEKHGRIPALLANTEWLFFSPDAPTDEFNSTIEALREYTKAEDDWTRALAISSLLLLGKGSPDLAAERNSLLDKGISHSDEFTFPEELHPGTETEAFRKELPQVLRLAFIHDPENHWITPEKFDPTNPDSRFFLSTPREFFAIAAEVLDPQGETELSKWRKSR